MRTLFTTFFVVWTVLLVAQSANDPDYADTDYLDHIITNDGEQIQGRVREFNRQKQVIKFRAASGGVKTYTPASIASWQQDDRYYFSRKSDVHPRKNIEAVFLELVSENTGPVRVYEFTFPNGRKTKLLERNNILTEVQTGHFRQQMKDYFQDQELIKQLIDDRAVKKNDLIALVEEYNDLRYEQDSITSEPAKEIFKKADQEVAQWWEFDDLLLSDTAARAKYLNLFYKNTEKIENKAERDIALNINVGRSFFEQNQYSTALEYLKKAHQGINEKKLMLQEKQAVERMIAEIYLNQKKYKLAIAYNSLALSEWKNRSRWSSQGKNVFQAYLQHGLILQKINPSTYNITWFHLSVPEHLKDWAGAINTADFPPVLHATEENKSDDYNLALLCFGQAQQLIPFLPQRSRNQGKLDLALAFGALYFEVGMYQEAQVYYEKGQVLIERYWRGRHPLAAKVKRILSEIYLANELYDQALSYIDEAQNEQLSALLQVDRSLLDNIDKIRFPFELVNSIVTKGIILYKKSLEHPSVEELEKVLGHYAIAATLLRYLRNIHQNEGSNVRLGGITHKLSQHAVTICHNLHQMTGDSSYLIKAFSYAELSKSAVLFEAVNTLKSMQISGIPQEDLILERGLKKQLAYLKGEIFYELQQGANKNLARLKALERKMDKIGIQHDALISRFEREYQAYYTLKYNNKEIKIKELQQSLKANEIFLEYVATDSFIYILGIDQQQVRAKFQPLTHTLSRTVRRMQYALRKNKAGQYNKHADQLYQDLIEPIQGWLKGKKLIIAPDAELHYLPFGVLPTHRLDQSLKGPDIYKNTRFLIEDHSICYNYSASLFLLSKVRHHDNVNKSIATWAPDFTNMREVIEEKGIEGRLGDLPGAQEEANQIANMFGSEAYLANNASELAFKRQAEKYSVLHIATHGLLNDDDPLFSSLIMSNEGKEDGILHAFELYSMQLNADLAVLSACNSGMGKLTKGEGVVSIARGFSYAGVPNIIMSKWPVSDWATQILMKSFYQKLKVGIPKDEALQQAKLDFLEEYRSKPRLLAPFYWGGFVLSGNTDPIETLKGDSGYLWWYLAGLGLLLLFIGNSLRKASSLVNKKATS